MGEIVKFVDVILVGFLSCGLCAEQAPIKNLSVGIPVHNETVILPSGELSGLAVFKQGIMLENNSTCLALCPWTCLTLDLYLPLHVQLDLNGGEVSLANDLALAGPFSFPSSGRIHGNEYSILLSGPTTIDGDIRILSNFTIDGRGNSLGLPGQLFVADGVTLTLRNMTFNLDACSLRCLGPDSRIVLEDVRINLNSDFDLSQGSLLIKRATISGPHTFTFSTTIPSLIDRHGLFHVLGGTELHFAAEGLNIERHLLNGIDETSVLRLDYNSTLSSETPGLIFDIGLILVDNNVKIISEGTSEFDAISLINPIRTREATMKLLAAAHLTVHGHFNTD